MLASIGVDTALAADVLAAPAGVHDVAASVPDTPGTFDTSTPAAAVRWSTASQFSGANYRVSASRGALDLGLRFDTPSVARQTADRRLEPLGPYVQMLPAVNVGLRDVDLGSASPLKQMSGADVASGTTHRVGIEWKPAESQLLFLRQGLGVRLSGDDRLTMRLKRGTLGLYMKQDF